MRHWKARLSFMVVLLAGSIHCRPNETNSEDLLSEVCGGLAPKVFRHISEVIELIREFNMRPKTCPQHLRSSFSDLEKLLSERNLKNACDNETFKSISNFHNDYIAEEANKPIPQSLANFFVVFAEGITGSCKENMIRRFNNEILKWSSIQDNNEKLNAVQLALKQKAKIAGRNLVNEPTSLAKVKLTDVILAEELKLHLLVKSPQNLIYVAKQYCENKFESVYEKIFSPVIRMYNLGYMGPFNFALNEEEKRLNKDNAFKRWFSIIQTCEMLKTMDVIVDTSEQTGDRDQISSINFAEAREVLAKFGKQPEVVDSSQYMYNPVWCEDHLWADNEKAVKEAVKEFYRRPKKIAVPSVATVQTVDIILDPNDASKGLKHILNLNKNKNNFREDEAPKNKPIGIQDEDEYHKSTPASLKEHLVNKNIGGQLVNLVDWSGDSLYRLPFKYFFKALNKPKNG